MKTTIYENLHDAKAEVDRVEREARANIEKAVNAALKGHRAEVRAALKLAKDGIGAMDYCRDELENLSRRATEEHRQLNARFRDIIDAEYVWRDGLKSKS